ncbi:hypothetical protein CVT26_011618 [Gymnopilus dilepis]|uniref:Uncharacterized protein n=1 Tax=Gymnopilus dilepis TaxID=231916 RepID=A0A409YQL4_9AGAR|nr:hypothetical protein CVT26_011618 [Gymnopilus dilepis]
MSFSPLSLPLFRASSKRHDPRLRDITHIMRISSSLREHATLSSANERRIEMEFLAPWLATVKEAHDEIAKASGDVRDDLLLFLQMLEVTINSLNGRRKSEIAQSPFVHKPYKIPTEAHLHPFPPSSRDRIVTLFKIIDRQRSELSEAVGSFMSVSEEAPTDFLHLSPTFYRYAFLISNAPRWCLFDDDFRAAQVTTFDLIYNVVGREDIGFEGFEELDHREQTSKLLSALEKLLPTGLAFEWRVVDPVDAHHPHLIYSRHIDSYPLIMASVTGSEMEMNEAFSQLLSSYATSFSTRHLQTILRMMGAPIFFLVVAGASLFLGLGFSDRNSGHPLMQIFPNPVYLEPDYGQNKRSGSRTLWALRKCIRSLNQETLLTLSSLRTRPVTFNTPWAGLLGTGLSVISTLFPGVIYNAKIDLDAATTGDIRKRLQAFVDSTGEYECIIKAIYPLNYEAYGTEAHLVFADAGLAPKYICEAPSEYEMQIMKEIGKQASSSTDFDSIIRLIAMQRLKSPTPFEPGWVSLAKLRNHHRALALGGKAQIRSAIDEILCLLRSKHLVHGDLRPNNIMVKICLQPELRFVPRKDNKSICIMVIDFDWAGKDGTARYPVIRNPAIPWPGNNGGLIHSQHDRKMVDDWMKDWP